MNDSSDDSSTQQGLANESLGKAIRFALGVIVIIVTYYPFRASFEIPTFQKFYTGMLGPGALLSNLTRFVFSIGTFLIILNSALFAAAIGVLFVRKIRLAIQLQGVIALISLLSGALTYQAVFQPFSEIVNRMQGGAPQPGPASRR